MGKEKKFIVNPAVFVYLNLVKERAKIFEER